MSTSYDTDVIAWANEQAALLRAGKFSELDIEHIADEVEDVGKSEERELESRMAVLLAHLLKWRFQPERRSKSWRDTLKIQRLMIERRLEKTPSLRRYTNDLDWVQGVWTGALEQAINETGLALDTLPSACPWSVQQVHNLEFLPD